MEHVLGQGRSSVQKQMLDAVRDQIPSSRTQKDIPFQDKHKVGRRLRQSAGTEDVVQSYSSENDKKSSLGRKACNADEEIVKHMSNLPGFLQQAEKRNNIQEKALNFGVLNWKHLEKWKYNEHMPGMHNKKPSSSISSSSGSVNGPPKTDLHLKRQPVPPRSHRSHLSSSKEETNATNQKEQKSVEGTKSKGKEICSPESEVAQNISIRSQQHNFHHKVKVYDRSCSKTNVNNRNDPVKEFISEKEASSSESGKDKLSLPSCDKTDVHEKKKETRLNDTVDFTSQYFPQDQQNVKIPDSIDTEICTSPHLGMHSEGKVSTVHEKTRRPSFSASYKTKDEITEQPIAKGRHPSPSRRFSFDLGRMSRSFSFRESSENPQLSSPHSTVKSGAVGPKASSVMNNFEKHKANANSRRMYSPLRRLLDPFLKHKGDQNENTVRLANGHLNSNTAPKGSTKGSTSKALLQLTLKNGLPSFKLVVDNSDDMLAAVVKKLSGSGKTDSCIIYEFYSVHEIRKKNLNWISQGSKSKNCSLGHKIIGHMKISNSSVCLARECFLYGVDEQNPDFFPNKEIASLVVMKSSGNLNDGDLNVTAVTDECKNSNGMVVILPGGPHGVPIKGTHSSLISRWRSGGSCDCGGWDVGCQLRILTVDKKGSGSISSSAIDRVDLFVQGGETKPVFSLKPCSNGLYSIELDASISLLEAFATCVAYVTCRKFSDTLDPKNQPNEEHLPKYVSCPPLSPAGRS